MPDPEPQDIPGELVKAEGAGPVEPELPPVTPPPTKAPIQFNQQVNVSIQQIPPSAWDRLTPEQIMELSKDIIKQIDVADKRQFDYAIEENKSQANGKKIALICGAAVALGGFGGTVFLAIHGHEIVALSIALPLTTVLAVVVGNRFLDR